MQTDLIFSLNSAVVKMRNIGRFMVDGYKKMVSLDQNEAAQVYKSLSANLYRRGNADRAIATMEKAVQLNPEDTQIAGQLGRAYYKKGRVDEALGILESNINKSPNPKDYYCLGQIYADQKKDAKALEALQKASKLSPDSAKIHYQLGTLFDKQKDYKKSIESFQKAIEINPHVPKYHFSLGFTQDSKGDHKAAISSFKKAIALEKE